MDKDLTEKDRAINHHTEIMAGTLVGLGVIALVQMLSVQSLDVPLKVSLYSFAVSVPSLSAVFLALRDQGSLGRMGIAESRFATLHEVLLFIGYLGSVIGISGLFFHFTTYAGIIFVAASLVGLVFCIGRPTRQSRQSP
jgi:hypothetical protein